MEPLHDHYPFGSLLPGRKYRSDSYDHGLNGILRGRHEADRHSSWWVWFRCAPAAAPTTMRLLWAAAVALLFSGCSSARNSGLHQSDLVGSRWKSSIQNGAGIVLMKKSVEGFAPSQLPRSFLDYPIEMSDSSLAEIVFRKRRCTIKVDGKRTVCKGYSTTKEEGGWGYASEGAISLCGAVYRYYLDTTSTDKAALLVVREFNDQGVILYSCGRQFFQE